jgi:hypothetical protein
MAPFIHQPDFSKYNDGDVFKEYATVGGSAPGNIVIDSDGEKALLFGIPGNWITYKKKFKNLIGSDNVITIEMPSRIEDPRWAYSDCYAFDGVGRMSGYVKWSIWNGVMYLTAYNNDQECAYNKIPLASIVCGPVDSLEHRIIVKFTANTVYLQFDDKTAIGTISKPGTVVDSLRIRAIGLITSQDKKTRVVTKYRCVLIKALKVTGEGV